MIAPGFDGGDINVGIHMGMAPREMPLHDLDAHLWIPD